MFNTLLVALDGGPQHDRVLDLAAAMAGPRSRLHLLCVLDPNSHWQQMPAMPTAANIPPPPGSRRMPKPCLPTPWPSCASAAWTPSHNYRPATRAK